MTRHLLFLSLILPATLLSAQDPKFNNQVSADSLTAVEKTLYRLMMDYRNGQDLAAIPISPALNYVAYVHARDLAENHPNVGYCNLHSWSETKDWKRCCYTPDHKNAPCMWNKPRELTTYAGDGFEIAYYTTAKISDAAQYAHEILNAWKNSKGHNAIIINKGIWKNTVWNAVGIGEYRGFTCVWFGREKDGQGFSIRSR